VTLFFFPAERASAAPRERFATHADGEAAAFVQWFARRATWRAQKSDATAGRGWMGAASFAIVSPRRGDFARR
jgi:hypothetical protein